MSNSSHIFNIFNKKKKKNNTSGKNIAVSGKTYDRLVAIGRFPDRTFDHLITRLLDERDGKENTSGGSF